MIGEIMFKKILFLFFVATISFISCDGEEKLTAKMIVKQFKDVLANETGIYDFGNVHIGTSSAAITFTIENTGDGNLLLTGTPDKVIADGGDAGMFTINETYTNSPVEKNGATTFTITFTPTSVGLKSTTISIANNTKSDNPYRFTVQGTGQTLIIDMNVKQGSTNIPNTTGVYDFGGAGIGTFTPAIEFTIENLGNADLFLSGSPKIQITGTDSAMFVINQSSTSSPIAPSEYKTFTITFYPTSEGSKSATISIPNNDPNKNPYTFEIVGLGFQMYCWTKRIGGTSDDYGYSITTDSSGNVYIIGDFEGTVDFGSDFGVSDSRTSVGGKNIFITKINSNGTYGWTKRLGVIGSMGSLRTLPITTDSSGNIYLTSYFEGTVDFGADFGVTDSKTSAGGMDVFITKILSDGTYGWTKRMGGTSQDAGYSVTTDSSDNVYFIGQFYLTVDFGADFSVSDSKTSSGAADTFITKINSNGTYGWTKSIGANYGRSITADVSGNIYIAGWFYSTEDFGADFSISDSKTSAGGSDAFVTKIDTNGNYGWTKRIGGTRYENGNSVTTDSSGNIYITGSYEIVVDFGADFGAADSKNSDGVEDIFVTRINSDGSYGWTKRMGDSGTDIGRSVTTDSAGDVFFTGNFKYTVDFGADFSVSDSKTYAGSNDIFINKVHSDGNYGWTKRMGGTNRDEGYSITADSLGNVYVVGIFYETVDFGADFSVSESKTSAGVSDIFITKLTP